MPVAAAIVRRQRPRGLGVEDREPREEREVGDLELDLLVRVLDHRRHRDLAAGAGGGRDAGERRDVERAAHAVVLARHQEEALLLARVAAVGEDRVGDLGRVHHGAAADREERVGARLLGGGGAVVARRASRSPAAPRRRCRPPRARRPPRPPRPCSTRPVPRITSSVTTKTRRAPSFWNSKPVELEQVAPGDHPGRAGVLVEVLEPPERGPVQRGACLHQAASSRSSRPSCSSSAR